MEVEKDGKRILLRYANVAIAFPKEDWSQMGEMMNWAHDDLFLIWDNSDYCHPELKIITGDKQVVRKFINVQKITGRKRRIDYSVDIWAWNPLIRAYEWSDSKSTIFSGNDSLGEWLGDGIE